VLSLLLPHLAGMVIVDVRGEGGRVLLLVRPAAAEAACTGCGALSGRLHGGYPRRLRDVPAGGRDVVIVLAARRFRCGNPDCAKATFTEQPGGLASRFARRTPPARAALTAVAAALCGRAGARLAAALGGAPPSRHTMIRLVMAVPLAEAAAAPQVLGIDDFAFRKGRVYGTVLIDVATGDVAGLLPDREAATAQEWLKAHPGAAVICRDRAGAYAEAASGGAPDAVQVADRWHLWHNLCEKTRETVTAHRASCLHPRDAPAGQQEHREPEPGKPQGQREPPAPEAEPGLAGRTRRRHAEVRQLLDAGHPKTAIARITGLSAPTVAKYAKAAAAGEITPAARESALDPYKPFLTRRWNDGARDATALHTEIKAQGYTGSDQPVRRFIAPFRDLPGPAPEPPAVPSARAIAGWLTTRPADLAAHDAAALAAVTAACPHLAALSDLIRAFAAMMNDRTGDRDLDAWTAAARASGLPPLVTLARGIQRDHAAVLNGLTLPWSSGKVEGTVNKIKMIKRQMYGRAGFPLLRQRVMLY
jgi:transposase